MLFPWAALAEEEKNQTWVRGNPSLSRPPRCDLERRIEAW